MLCLSSRLKKILLISIIFITGCTAKYNITINDDKDLIESLDIIETDQNKFNEKNKELYDTTLTEYLNTDLKWPTPVYMNSEENPIEPKKIDNIDYYKKENKSSESLLDLKYSFNHKQINYNKSNIVSSCYEYNFTSNNNNIKFETTSDFKCFEKYKMLDSVEFELNTTCNMSGNYDKNIDNTYTWIINKENISKKISFMINCKKDKKDDFELSVITIFGVYVFIILFLVLMLRIVFALKNRL